MPASGWPPATSHSSLLLGRWLRSQGELARAAGQALGRRDRPARWWRCPLLRRAVSHTGRNRPSPRAVLSHRQDTSSDLVLSFRCRLVAGHRPLATPHFSWAGGCGARVSLRVPLVKRLVAEIGRRAGGAARYFVER